MIKVNNATRILQDLKIEVWYNGDNKTVYIYPPVKVIHFLEIKNMLKYYNLEIKNIVVGRLNETYW